MLIPITKRTQFCFVACEASKKGKPCPCNPNPIIRKIKTPKKDERN